jgi:hypothetical protein
MMLKTYIWMAILLLINWGGFIVLLIRTMRKQGPKAKERR